VVIINAKKGGPSKRQKEIWVAKASWRHLCGR
jgi:hypothetical protein